MRGQRTNKQLPLWLKFLLWPAGIVLALNIERCAETSGWDKFLAGESNTLMPEILVLLQSGWFQFPAVIIVALFCGAWFQARFGGVAASPTEDTSDNAQSSYDPWAAPDVETFIELHIDAEEWKAVSTDESNIFNHSVRINKKENMEIVILFDKWIVSRDAVVTCNNKKEGYRTSVDKITDRHALLSLRSINFPCTVRIDF